MSSRVTGVMANFASCSDSNRASRNASVSFVIICVYPLVLTVISASFTVGTHVLADSLMLY